MSCSITSPGQLSLAIPSWVDAMSTSESRHTEKCTSPVSMVLQCELVSGWGLRKRRSVTSYGVYGSESTLHFYILRYVYLIENNVCVDMHCSDRE